MYTLIESSINNYKYYGIQKITFDNWNAICNIYANIRNQTNSMCNAIKEINNWLASDKDADCFYIYGI